MAEDATVEELYDLLSGPFKRKTSAYAEIEDFYNGLRGITVVSYQGEWWVAQTKNQDSTKK